MLLSLAVALNASQAMVLCLGCDGHVAVEPVGHDHGGCCGAHVHKSDTAFSPESEDASCLGCVDIPLPGETPNGAASGRPKIIVAAAADMAPSCPIVESGSVHAAGAWALDLLIFYHIPLRSIVLQV